MKRILTLLFLALAACRSDVLPPVPSVPDGVTEPDLESATSGFYLLNEANMGSNKCTLDWFDARTGVYHKNIFETVNPGVARGLGDVGNDLQIYRGRLWAVINCSNLVEVMDAATGKHVGSVSIPNCRYVVFDGDYAYVSSYAGEVELGNPDYRKGYVAKIDINTLEIVGTCEVGYQPEQMVISEGMLFVANSGGYMAPNYDSTISVIRLMGFAYLYDIEDVAVNLHRMKLDSYGRLWVSSRGDHGAVKPSLVVVKPGTETVPDEFVATFDDIDPGDMCMSGDKLFVVDMSNNGYSVFNTRTLERTDHTFGGDPMKHVYGLRINPSTGDMIVTDAKDYVTPGTVRCYDKGGALKWSVTAGDIPAHIAFTTASTAAENRSCVAEVLEYLPAPGQFVNSLPEWKAGDTQAAMNAKAFEFLQQSGRPVSLGGWGGSLTVRLTHSVANTAGPDLRIEGNFIENSSEPGIVMVAADANRDGKPDQWFEIAGSASARMEDWYESLEDRGNDVELISNYELTWHRPADPHAPVSWSDNRGANGVQPRLDEYHKQPYFPQWVEGDITFRGTRLPQNGYNSGSEQSPLFILKPFLWGYVDNDNDGRIDIDWAVDAAGKPVHLKSIDFVRVYNGMHQNNGWIGENSTEVDTIKTI